MKISHGRLEVVRSDIAAFTAEQYFNPRSKWRTLQYAVFEYHRHGVTSALSRFDRDFHRQFVGVGDFDLYADQLELYIARHRRLGSPTVEVKRRIHLDLTPTVYLAGEVPRIDLNVGGGFTACLFFRTATNWVTELRMPLLQLELARSLGLAVSQVSMAAYQFDTGNLERRRYARAEIDSALEEAKRIAERLDGL